MRNVRNRLVNDLRASVVRGEFELHYQPIFDARTLRPREMEALVPRPRAQLSEGLLYPDRFIGIAEEAGLMESLGHWILQRACADALSWPEDIKVAVNLSPTQFRGTLLSLMLYFACSWRPACLHTDSSSRLRNHCFCKTKKKIFNCSGSSRISEYQ